jgi:DNA-binding CsgD family transcriptional regulator
MRNSAALKQLRLIGSLGLSPQQAIPLMLEQLEQVIPCLFANFFWLSEEGFPQDSYLPVFIPSAMDAFIGNQRRLVADPLEPTIDKCVRLGLRTGGSQALLSDRNVFRRSILFNEVYRPYGIGDVLELTVREAGRPRGMVFLNRESMPGRWTAAEVALLLDTESHFLAALNAPPTSGHGPAAGAPPDGSAYLLVEESGRIRLATDTAITLLAQYLDVPFSPDFRFGEVLAHIPPPMAKQAGRATAAARESRLTRWGEISAHAFRAGPLVPVAAAEDQFIIVLEKRLGRAARVASAVGKLPLAPREREIACLVGMDVSFGQIAERLRLSPATLRSYLKSIYERTGVAGRDHLIPLLTGSAQPVLH